MHNHHMKMSVKTRFENEATGNSEWPFLSVVIEALFLLSVLLSSQRVSRHLCEILRELLPTLSQSTWYANELSCYHGFSKETNQVPIQFGFFPPIWQPVSIASNSVPLPEVRYFSVSKKSTVKKIFNLINYSVITNFNFKSICLMFFFVLNKN